MGVKTLSLPFICPVSFQGADDPVPPFVSSPRAGPVHMAWNTDSGQGDPSRDMKWWTGTPES